MRKYKTVRNPTDIRNDLWDGIIHLELDPDFSPFDADTLVRALRFLNEGINDKLTDVEIMGKTMPLFWWLGKFEIEVVDIPDAIDEVLDNTLRVFKKEENERS